MIACFYASEGFPSKHECKNIFMVIFLILIDELLSKLHADKNNALQNTVFYQTATWNY